MMKIGWKLYVWMNVWKNDWKNSGNRGFWMHRMYAT